jgi:peptidoglycan/LPS O-acetylase OafA/YrhL/lysophospholipase L1-like esterase
MSSTRRGLDYQPALDGVRAVAVTMVLVFHGGFSWMTGGYVGVSVFFTLSGYLITTLLIVEFDRSETIDVGEFYRRRIKRLLPASAMCLGAVAFMARLGLFRGVPHLRSDFLGAVFQVANWTKLGHGDSYADLISRKSGVLGPLDHYWSLAIEEQFYWLWPVVMLVLLRLLRSPRARAVALTALAVSLIALAPVVAKIWGPNAGYWATPARLGEIVVGAATAAILRLTDRRPKWLAVPGLAGLAAMVGAALTWPASGGPAYAGALGVFSLASAALIIGLQEPSPLRRAMSVRPVVWLGRVSYGVYLYHWPVYAVVNDSRFHVSTAPLFVVRAAVTLAAATISMWLLEQPVRRSVMTVRPTMLSAATGCLAVAALALIIPVIAATRTPSPVEAAAVRLQPVQSLAPLLAATTTSTLPPVSSGPSASTTPSSATSTTLAPLPVPSRPVRILMVGDSTAEATGAGLIAWAKDHPDLAKVTMLAGPGCGVIRDGTVSDDPTNAFKKPCDELLGPRLDRDLRELKPDIVVVMVTLSDLGDRTWTMAEGELSPFDASFQRRLTDDYHWLSSRILAAGVPHLAWIRPPIPAVPWQGDAKKMGDPARYEVQHDLMETIAAENPTQVSVIVLDSWLTSMNGDTDVAWRPDGLHFSPDAARRAVDEFLGEQILRVALTT